MVLRTLTGIRVRQAGQAQGRLLRPAPSSGGGPSIAVHQQLAGGAAVGGGSVQAYHSGTLQLSATAAIDGAGNAVLANLIPGQTYYVMPHPPPTHFMESAEVGALSFDITAQRLVAAGGATTILVRVATSKLVVGVAGSYFDNFESYADDADWRTNGCITSQTNQNGGWAARNPTKQFMDNAGGPAGDRCLRFDFPARPVGPCPDNDITIGPMIAFNTAQAQNNWWQRIKFKLQNPWQNGSQNSCAGGSWEYKTCGRMNPPGGGFYGTLLKHGGGAGGANLVLDIVLSSGAGQGTSLALQGNEIVLGTPANWSGAWRTWIMEIKNHGAGLIPTLKFFQDGVLLRTLTDSVPYAFPNAQFGFSELFSNLDTGPDTAQSLWVKEWGIYKGSRPGF